jgi:hypothetical protein
MFTRLEGHIREQSGKLIGNQQAHLSQWKLKRVWDVLAKHDQDDHLHFKDRLALLLEKGSKDHRTVIEYYKLRNELGHGGNFSRPVSIPDMVDEFDRLRGILSA